jgi:putative holliday junction resolvase
MGKVMAIDMGSVRVGLAISDESQTLASGHGHLKFKGYEDLIRQIIEIAHRESVMEFVVGLPLNMDGSHGSQAVKAEKFAGMLKYRSGLPVTLSDETLSTVEATRLLRAAGKKATRDRIDAAAATVILQAFLDEQKKG